MPSIHEGGCLCGSVRYRTLADPVRVTICHCTFCQRFTGTAYLVEPIFRKEDVALDDPNWFERGQGSCRHIFTRSAQEGVVLPAGIKTYPEHALRLDGTANEPIVLAHALTVSRRQP
jgi:hypothetical protein